MYVRFVRFMIVRWRGVPRRAESSTETGQLQSLTLTPSDVRSLEFAYEPKPLAGTVR